MAAGHPTVGHTISSQFRKRAANETAKSRNSRGINKNRERVKWAGKNFISSRHVAKEKKKWTDQKTLNC